MISNSSARAEEAGFQLVRHSQDRLVERLAGLRRADQHHVEAVGEAVDHFLLAFPLALVHPSIRQHVSDEGPVSRINRIVFWVVGSRVELFSRSRRRAADQHHEAQGELRKSGNIDTAFLER